MSANIIISIILSLITFGLAIFILLANPKNKINIWFSLSMVSTTLWGITESLVLFSRDINWILFWGKLSYIAGLTIPFCFLFFSHYFPIQTNSFNKKIISIAFILYLIGFASALVPFGAIKNAVVSPEHGDLVVNPFGFSVWFAVFMVLFIWGYGNLIYKYYHSSGFQKIQLQHLIVFTLIPVVVSTIFAALYPAFKGESLGWIGVHSLFVLVAGCFYFLFFSGRKLYLK